MWAIGSGFVSAAVPDDERLHCTAFGARLRNPLGLAAGFDKNGVAIEGLENMGFGFIEVGTVTPLEQPGNPKPRMFRIKEEEALVNRLGFNNRGALALQNSLRARDVGIPVGVNIGKGIDTPVERAVDDYVACAKAVGSLADYLVVNVSSPNTPGLRTLQHIESLALITESIRKVTRTPLFVKASPDESDDALREIGLLAREQQFGLVATNTTVDHDIGMEGGLSGKPLKARAQKVCALLRETAGDSCEIIGVGGIFTGGDLRERLAAGASVCQIYTALVYRGPSAAADILREFLDA